MNNNYAITVSCIAKLAVSFISFLQYPDLLQLLVDARADSDDEDESTESVVTDYSKKKLTDVEIVRTAISFLLAGQCAC